MTLEKRRQVYLAQTGRKVVTRRQWRRFKKKAWRDEIHDPPMTQMPTGTPELGALAAITDQT